LIVIEDKEDWGKGTFTLGKRKDKIIQLSIMERPKKIVLNSPLMNMGLNQTIPK
jgi:hypothetical protein